MTCGLIASSSACPTKSPIQDQQSAPFGAGAGRFEQLQQEEEQEQLSLFQPSPEELKAAEELRTQAEDLLFRTFYRALKARIMTHQNPVPVQVMRRDTFLRPDDEGQSNATRAWNLATSLYYKAGHEPWRPAILPATPASSGFRFITSSGGRAILFTPASPKRSQTKSSLCAQGFDAATRSAA